MTNVQWAALRDVTPMGVPLRAWTNYRYLLGLDGDIFRASLQVTLSADVQAPLGAGQVVSVEWDPNGSGAFTAWRFGPARV